MPPPIKSNMLYYGDNLDILREYIADESVDLIYLDPPFNSNRSYNVLFRHEGGKASEAQVNAFSDTWHWGAEAERTFHDLVTNGSAPVANMMGAMRQFIGDNQMMAYLVMMAARLVELHRVLKPTGSLYLHCDPTASHYLKVVLDIVFEPENFHNEIIWQRSHAKGHAFTRFATNHDVIFRYSRSGKWTWNAQYTAHDPDYVDKFYKYVEPETRRRYTLDNLLNPNPDRPNLTYEFLGVTRVWRWTKQRMQEAYEKGLVVQSRPGTVPRLKRYLDEQEGTPVGDVWTDIPPIQSQSAELLGYPTQKPIALLERIVAASSNPGDVVLDPFCGCGTTIHAAQKLGRAWIGIDVTRLAIALQKYRLKDAFGLVPGKDFAIVGEPQDLADAIELSKDDRHQFEWWALSLIAARPINPDDASGKKGKKGADRGIDGQILFEDDPSGKLKRVIVQVKSGHVSSSIIRDLRGVVEREKADIGVLITLEPPSQPMVKEATAAGFYHSPGWGKEYPRLQILTVEGLLAGVERLNIPPNVKTFKRAQKEAAADSMQTGTLGLFTDE